jgi:hypothetical protein
LAKLSSAKTLEPSLIKVVARHLLLARESDARLRMGGSHDGDDIIIGCK